MSYQKDDILIAEPGTIWKKKFIDIFSFSNVNWKRLLIKTILFCFICTALYLLPKFVFRNYLFGLTLFLSIPTPIVLLLVYEFRGGSILFTPGDKLKIETHIADFIDRKADELLNPKDQSVAEIPRTAKQLKIEVLPNCYKGSTTKRLAEFIIDEGNARSLDSINAAMQPYKDESYDPIFKLQTIQKIALRVGILGTFIGLTFAFLSANLSSSKEAEKFVTSVVDSLGFAFLTSIGGLVLAVVLGAGVLWLKQKQEAYFISMEKCVRKLVVLVRGLEPTEEYMTQFKQLKISLDRLYKNVYDQARVIENHQLITEKQSESIRDGLQRLHSVKLEFTDFLDQLKEAEYTFINEMKGIYQTLSPEAINEHLKNSLELTTTRIADTFDHNSKYTLEKYQEFNTTIELLNTNLDKTDSILNNHSSELNLTKEDIESTRNELFSSITELAILQKKLLKKLEKTQVNQAGTGLIERSTERIMKVGNKFIAYVNKKKNKHKQN